MTLEQIVWRHIKQNRISNFTAVELHGSLSASGKSLTLAQVTGIINKLKTSGKVVFMRKEGKGGRAGFRTRHCVAVLFCAHNMPMLPGQGRAA